MTIRRHTQLRARTRLAGPLAAAGAILLAGCGGGSDPAAGSTSASAAPSSTSTPAPPSTPSSTPQQAESSSDPAPATPTSDASPAGDPPGTECETVVLTAAEQPAYVFIRAGVVRCAEATRVMQDYYLALQRGEAPGAGGGGPVPVRDWTCSSGPATDPGSVCTTADGRRIEAEIDAR